MEWVKCVHFLHTKKKKIIKKKLGRSGLVVLCWPGGGGEEQNKNIPLYKHQTFMYKNKKKNIQNINI